MFYDNANRITSIDSSEDGVSDFVYDDRDQLTSADHDSPRTDESYEFDDNGNRDSTGYTTGTNNQTTEDPTYTYQFDKEGNRTRRTLKSDSSYEEYTWDHRNRLTKVTFKTSGGTVTKTVEYAYDVFNRLVRQQVDPDGAGSAPKTNQFFAAYDGIQPTILFDGTSSSDVSHRLLWGPAIDQLLADEQVTSTSSAGNVLWPLADHLGTARDIADFDEGSPDFAVTNHRTYDSFGNLTDESNSSVDLPFGFTSKFFDPETGLNNHWNRWYDSALGKWVNEDPIGFSAGDHNIGRYVGNSPTIALDPSGRIAIGIMDGPPSESEYEYAPSDDWYWGPHILLYFGRWSVPADYYHEVMTAAEEDLVYNQKHNPARTALNVINKVDPTPLTGPVVNLLEVYEEGGDLSDVAIRSATDFLPGPNIGRKVPGGRNGPIIGINPQKPNVNFPTIDPPNKVLSTNLGNAPRNAKTPNSAARSKAQGEYVDPMTNKVIKTDEPLAADHIFPKSRVKELPGFDQLTPEQQSEVLNHLPNIQGLPQSLNSSKGNKLDWDTYKGKSLDPQYENQLKEMQQSMQIQLQGLIDAYLSGAK